MGSFVGDRVRWGPGLVPTHQAALPRCLVRSTLWQDTAASVARYLSQTEGGSRDCAVTGRRRDPSRHVDDHIRRADGFRTGGQHCSIAASCPGHIR